MVYDWFAEGRRGQRSLEDETHLGHSAAATTTIQMVAVQKLVEEDGRVTVLQIAEEASISSGKCQQHTTQLPWIKQGLSKMGTP